MSSSRPAISVIIPTWKRGDLLRKCLQALHEQSFADFEIAIVSSGAGEWAESLAREFGARVLRLPENRGFAKAINAGIEASQSPFIVLLNDDAELDSAWLAHLAAMLEKNPD